jgi:branched-chain amino acid transport system permease protein
MSPVAITRARRRLAAIVALAAVFVVVPLCGSDYWFSAVLVPFLVFALAGTGQNLLTGYAGQLSLGSAAFMSIGAFATYDVVLHVPGVPLLAAFAIGGLFAAAAGVIVGLPSARVSGFYLIASTLAAQFFVEWLFTKVGWFSNHDASGVITAPPLVIAGHDFGSPAGRYLLTLAIVVALTVIARNLVRGELGRRFMAVRDRETAAAASGVPVVRTKLTAFALSSFYCGIAGALWAFAYVGTVEPHGFDLDRSFQILFLAIIGGLGSIAGAFLGAAFLVFLPLFMDHVAMRVLSGHLDPGNLQNVEKVVFGIVIILFVVKEPEGLARLWHRARDRVRRWPLDA